MIRRPLWRQWALSLLLPLALSAGAHAESADQYPDDTVRLIVAYPAGGATDTLARLLANQLSQAWEQPVVVENRPGASGITGTAAVARADADGHTLLLGITAMVQSPALFASLPYDPSSDFVPLAEVARSQNLLVVPERLGVKTFEEFVAKVRAAPGEYTYGSYGNGTSAHIHGEMLKHQLGLDMRHIPYKGAAPQVTDVLAERLDAALLDAGSARSHLDSGKFRVLAVSGNARSPLLPDVPTLGELGVRNSDSWGWFGLFAPAGTPAPIAEKIARQTAAALSDPKVAGTIEGLGLQPGQIVSDAFGQMYARDLGTWTEVIRETGITLN